MFALHPPPSTVPGAVSLTRRITLLVIGLLLAVAVTSGEIIYVILHRSLQDDLQERLDARMLWMQTSLEVEEGRLQLGPVPEAENASPNWEISRPDGQVLWSARGTHLHRPVISISGVRVMGDPGWPPLADIRLQQTEPPPGHTEDPEQSKGLLCFPYFALPPEHRRVDLVLTAWDSGAGVEAARRRVRTILWTAGPALLAAAALLFWLAIRWQLKPLGRMAEQVAGIGPANLSSRLDFAGTSQECVRLRDMINTMLGRLAEGLERERRFASAAAHEMRTPLAQLRTSLEVGLRRERSPGEYQEAMRDALADVERLQRLIQGLLHLSRASEGGEIRGQPVRLRAILRKAEKEFGPLALSPADGMDDVVVSGDEELLYSAVGNVLENAARHAPGKPPEVSVSLEGDRLRLSIADHGPGVPEAERERIFAPLVRLDGARTVGDGHGGFGLGLAIARSTMRQFGGDLVCRDRADGAPGAEFVFWFRIIRQD